MRARNKIAGDTWRQIVADKVSLIAVRDDGFGPGFGGNHCEMGKRQVGRTDDYASRRTVERDKRLSGSKLRMRRHDD